jgi:hypothetical protein
MVNENQELAQEPVQAPLPETPSPAPDNPLIAEVDTLNNMPEVDISEPGAPAPEPEAPAPVAQEPTAPTQPTPEQMQQNQQFEQMSQQAAQYQQVQERAAFQQEAQRYQQQLESQGYMADQAQQIAHQHMQSRQAQVNTARQHQFQTQILMGKQAAAEHFAKTHNLGFDAMATLRLAETPEQMEQIAKKMSSDAKNMDELTKLRQAQVPAQQFDSSQGEPQVASNDGSWLDRYNAGDRSANATAAARRLMGI